jgi:hypothetical protein
MRKKSLLMYWADKRYNATTISARMGCGFRFSASSDSWVTKWLQALKRGEDIFESCERSRTPQDPLTGLKVLELFNSTESRASAKLPQAPRYCGQLYEIV